MFEFVEPIALGLSLIFALIGLAGTIIPLLPGVLLIWLAVLGYGALTGFATLSGGSLLLISLIALVTGTSDYWMSYFGAKKGGASKEGLLYGVGGAIIGTIVLPLLGTIIGYAAGLLYGEYRKRGDWEAAKRAAFGGLAGWGIATAVQFIGGVLMLAIFIAQIF